MSKEFMGTRDRKKLAALFGEIDANEKAVLKLALKTARSYYDAGNIIAGALRRWTTAEKTPTIKSLAAEIGYPERRITIALKIFKGFENNPDALKGLTLRDALKMIAPPPPAGDEGYNRIDLGGDPGQMRLDFGELFELPASGNKTLQNYRTVGDLISEIIVVKRTPDGDLISKRFAHFSEDIPQDPAALMAYKKMSQITQAAIEDYLAVIEQKEEQR